MPLPLLFTQARPDRLDKTRAARSAGPHPFTGAFMKPEILLAGHLRPLLDMLEPHFVVHRLWEAADRDAFLREVGPRVRALAPISATWTRSTACPNWHR